MQCLPDGADTESGGAASAAGLERSSGAIPDANPGQVGDGAGLEAMRRPCVCSSALGPDGVPLPGLSWAALL